jgi:DNA-binding response OmpR family regulator
MAARNACMADTDAGKRVVVVIEADDLIRDLIARWLEDAGYAVASHPHAGAIDAVRTPCVVIVELPRPRRDAEVLQRIRAAYACPVVALSARFRHGLHRSAAAAARLGVDQVLPKPFTRTELLAAVAAAEGANATAD